MRGLLTVVVAMALLAAGAVVASAAGGPPDRDRGHDGRGHGPGIGALSRRRGKVGIQAFSSEVGTGSREEARQTRHRAPLLIPSEAEGLSRFELASTWFLPTFCEGSEAIQNRI